MSCYEQINDEKQTFQVGFMVSISLTLICGVVRAKNRASYQQDPEKGYKTLFGFAGIKFVMGILLATVLQPQCPEGCEDYCQGKQVHDYFYPTVVFLIATYWAYLGKIYLDMSKEKSGAVPATEMPSGGIV